MNKSAEGSRIASWLFLRKKTACVVALVFGIALTYLIWMLSAKQSKQLSRLRFEREVENSMYLLDSSLNRHFDLLVSLQGFFHASDEVTRLDFRNLLKAFNLVSNFPGVHGLSWNEAVTNASLANFENDVRGDTSLMDGGYPDFSVRPAMTPYMDRFVVTYIEPMAGNESAFGYDIGSDPARRLAVERTRDTGRSVATARINLVQEESQSSGFLYMLPVYGNPFASSQAERVESFRGVVVAVYRVSDLVRALGDFDYERMIVTDVTEVRSDVAGEVLFRRGGMSEEAVNPFVVRELIVGGRVWELKFARDPEKVAWRQSTLARVIVVLGGLASILATLLIYSLATSRQYAIARAEDLTRDLRITNSELSRSNTDLSRLAYVASHDLQTPVRNIISSISLLRDELGSSQSEATKEYFLYLTVSAGRIKRLLDDLLENAQIGIDELDLKEIDVNKILCNVQSLLADQIQATNATITVGKLPVMFVDEIKIERVFQNLISNAIKYRKPDRTAIVRISAQQDAELWRFTVSDNGLGIEHKYHKSIFEPFRRLHSYDAIPGSGLGLGIVRQLVQKHGGDFILASSDQEGSVFQFTLSPTLLEDMLENSAS